MRFHTVKRKKKKNLILFRRAWPTTMRRAVIFSSDIFFFFSPVCPRLKRERRGTERVRPVDNSHFSNGNQYDDDVIFTNVTNPRPCHGFFFFFLFIFSVYITISFWPYVSRRRRRPPSRIISLARAPPSISVVFGHRRRTASFCQCACVPPWRGYYMDVVRRTGRPWDAWLDDDDVIVRVCDRWAV